MCANFQLKQTTLTFLAQICPKRKLGFEIQKTNVGIRISILEIPCVPSFRQNGQLWIFGPKFSQKWIFRSEFQKSKSGFGISYSNIHKPFLLDKFRKYNIKQTPKISILVVSKYKTNKDFIKIVVYFDDTISSFSTKISYKQCC